MQTSTVSGMGVNGEIDSPTLGQFESMEQEVQLIQARRLIENTREQISVVANMVGYSQLNNFYVHFKDYYHVSPSALRRFDEAAAPPPLPTGPGLEDAEALAEETSKLTQ